VPRPLEYRLPRKNAAAPKRATPTITPASIPAFSAAEIAWPEVLPLLGGVVCAGVTPGEDFGLDGVDEDDEDGEGVEEVVDCGRLPCMASCSIERVVCAVAQLHEEKTGVPPIYHWYLTHCVAEPPVLCAISEMHESSAASGLPSQYRDTRYTFAGAERHVGRGEALSLAGAASQVSNTIGPDSCPWVEFSVIPADVKAEIW
jgi:hypothetical protein